MYFCRGLHMLGAQDYSDEKKLAVFMYIFHPEMTPRQVHELVKERYALQMFD